MALPEFLRRCGILVPEALEHRFGGGKQHLLEEASRVLPGEAGAVVRLLCGGDNHDGGGRLREWATGVRGVGGDPGTLGGGSLRGLDVAGA